MIKEIKVGIIGLFRGMSFVGNAKHTGMKLVALCDSWEERLHTDEISSDVARYSDYGEFLNHDMDAVILANYFHEHAPFAIKALKKGKHVMSECNSNFTIAEGIELCEAVEDTGLIYMLAENYPYTKVNQELKKLYLSGELGKAVYAEGEYNHPMSEEEYAPYIPSPDHWRAWLPRGYYCTHALAPLMFITDLMPKIVTGFAAGETGGGWAGMVQMEEGAVFRLIGGGMPGHSCFYRIHGTKGAAESVHGPGYFGPEQVRVWHEHWNNPFDSPLERAYVPDFPTDVAMPADAGHGGGDFWVDYHFAQAIRTGTQPFLDVYRGVAMSTVGILLDRSIKSGGMPQEMPDFRDKTAREKFRSDNKPIWP
ncbi:MAG: Gfo/Idh/MocA family oxidoreductase [Defluviitaleaceae bacterium]|nr:Gfo/Idh/MocA family oxidoreductase [Defluviitaleaceae bacterium]